MSVKQDQPVRTGLDEAIHLAKSGRRPEACEALREMLALEPQNQTAWLWLSAISISQAEARQALSRIRQINPAHPSLPQAEQWLAERFAAEPTAQKPKIPDRPTIPTKPVATNISRAPKSTAVAPSPTATGLPAIDTLQPESNGSRYAGFFHSIPSVPASVPALSIPASPVLENLFRSVNVLAFGLAILAALAGLAVLFVGLVWEIRGPALASELAQSPGSYQNESSFALNASKENEAQKLDEAPAALKKAKAEQDWSRAVAVLEKLYQLKPESAAVKRELAEARYQKGLSLRSRGLIEEALVNFERAAEVFPEKVEAQQELQLASIYVTAIQQYQAGQWQGALEGLEAVWAKDKGYPNLEDLLFSAYYNQALALEAAGELAQAKADLEAALRLHPEQSAPRRLLAEIEFALAPQTPLESPISMTPIEDRTILVGIAEQRMIVYEGGKEVFDFVVSTGEPGRDTAVGEFEILNKIDMAYASTWNLDMPYWLGIYWAGPLQNGIHSLPIVKHTGYKLWDGYLGQRVSYGCVILSDEDAAKLYGWAEVGTKVKIVPSLAGWSPEE